MATPIHTGIHELNDLIGGPGKTLVDWCPGYPLGRITEFLVDETDREEVFDLLKKAFTASSARWNTHRTGPGVNGYEMFEGLWLSVTAPAPPAPVEALYDMGGGLSADQRYRVWQSLLPKLNSVLRTHERTCVVGFSLKDSDTMPERAYASLRISVSRVGESFKFEVVKSTVSAAAGYSITLGRALGPPSS